MNPAAAKRHAVPKFFFILILVIVAICIAYAALQNSSLWSWPVPEEAKQLKNPVPETPAALETAKNTYKNKCANCHGDAGAGDGPDAERYDPPPADFTDPKIMRGVTDGELFYKISEGKKPMPAFKTKLTEEQRWQLVLLIRSLSGAASTDSR